MKIPVLRCLECNAWFLQMPFRPDGFCSVECKSRLADRKLHGDMRPGETLAEFVARADAMDRRRNIAKHAALLEESYRATLRD